MRRGERHITGSAARPRASSQLPGCRLSAVSVASSTLITSSVSASPSATRRSCASPGASLIDAALPMGSWYCVRQAVRSWEGWERKRCCRDGFLSCTCTGSRVGKTCRISACCAAGAGRERAEGAAAAMRRHTARKSRPHGVDDTSQPEDRQVVPPARATAGAPLPCRSCGGRRMRRRRRRQVCDLARWLTLRRRQRLAPRLPRAPGARARLLLPPRRAASCWRPRRGARGLLAAQRRLEGSADAPLLPSRA